MGFWIFMLMMNLLIPLSMIGFGWMFLKSPPKEINAVFGYRTRRSMLNPDTWEFAHRYFGKLWLCLGLILLPVSVLLMLLLLGKAADTVGIFGGALVMLQCVVLIVPIFPTERALKRTFDESGRRK